MRKKTIIIVALALLTLVCATGCDSAIQIPDQHYAEVASTPINANASPNARKLMRYLASVYGKKMISGQYLNEYEYYGAERFQSDGRPTVFKANELVAIHAETGQYPAIIGLDLSERENNPDKNYSIEQALEWHKAGGIVTFCWHWKEHASDASKRHFYTEQTDFDLKAALADKNGDAYARLIADIDFISAELKPLADADVPILWRPLHEASGGWFWWGASGAEAYRELWDILYERMTIHNGLNNLLWVANAQNSKWYVGNDKCDLVGDDPYFNDGRKAYEKDPANSTRFKKVYRYAENKMIVMSENDYLPDIDQAFDNNTKWLFYATWTREFVCEKDENQTEIDKNGNVIETWARYTPVYSERYASKAELKKVYSDQRIITLSALKSSGYEIA